MSLPGGLWHDGRLEREYAFKALDGALELALAEAGAASGSVPERVGAVLAVALARLGDAAATPERVSALCVTDRQFLMRELAALVDDKPVWLAAVCHGCGEPFDVPVEPAQLPLKPAGAGYPWAEADTAGGRVRLHVPSGADQAAIAAIADTDEAMLALAQRCRVEGPPIGAEDLPAIDAAFERVAPELALAVAAVCPGCGAANTVPVAPYRSLDADADALFDEIHALASHYHWGEAEILALPRERRRRYLRLIERARGMSA
jgi:hypothetical protein